MYQARILCDSISPAGVRLTTMEVTYPRFVHSEFMTHRMFSRNAASSRAIPIKKMIANIIADPVEPVYWGKNQSGMQAKEELSIQEQADASQIWADGLFHAIEYAELLDGMGVHKQIVNRLLEPWMWITVIVSATEWDNFFHLRCHPDAQPEIQKIAYMMEELYHINKPTEATIHVPLIYPGDELVGDLWTIETMKKVSVGRCARVSYLTHDGKRDPTADIELCNRLVDSGHWSPFEHVATASSTPDHWFGNFRGWQQYRKEFKGENYTEQ